MTPEQIKNLFSHSYNQKNWKQFLGETFTNANLPPKPLTLKYINTNVATQAQLLGYIMLNENDTERQIGVYEVTLAQGIVLERNRVGLRNLLRNEWKNIDGAFITYHKADSTRWRFTYVSELTGYDADGEFIKIKTEPKRYTYVLGEGESTRTATERFTAMATKGAKITLNDIKEAFSVEKLSKAFFDEYKKHYDAFCNFMLVKPGIKQTLFNGDEKAIRDFNKKLLGRIVFLYFIQKKGWLGVPQNEDWGKGDYNFLTQQFHNFRNKDLFYQDFLAVLFFDTLNCERTNDLFNYDNSNFTQPPSVSVVKIPYLNGGLFEEEDKKHRAIIFSAQLFSNLFNFFNQYNFTIYEDDPNDHTIAVDPEMLGHIFENLLEDNKDKGAFYTPKEIVHYMCQESLIEYLDTNINAEKKQAIKTLQLLIPATETSKTEASEWQNQIVELQNQCTDARKQLTNFIKHNTIDKDAFIITKQCNELLDTVKICDPAIGSGAFPMGLLHEIFTAKQTLHTLEHGNAIHFDASAVKLNSIQNSIYGVDIEKGAVDIARLRFWLSLIVDEEKPKALPNLDYKIVVGNSLVSKLGNDVIDIDWTVNETTHGLFGADLALQKSTILTQISVEQRAFFSPNSNKKDLAKHIRNLKIDLLITQLELMCAKQNIHNPNNFKNKPKAKIAEETKKQLETLGWKSHIKHLQKLKTNANLPLLFFDWKLDFPEVMNQQLNANAGFDIVIGNPPYVNVEKIDQSIKDNISKFKTAHQKYDLYVLFYEAALNLLKQKGILSYITSNKFLSQGYGLKLRQEFLQYKIDQIINFNYDVFESATVQTCIVQVTKTTPAQNHTIEVIDVNTLKDKDNFTNRTVVEIPQKIFDETDENNFRINLTKDKIVLLNKIKSNTLPLYDICSVNYGLRPSSEKLGLKKEAFIHEAKTNSKFKKYFEGKDMGYWILNTNSYLDYQPEKMYNPMFPELFENNKLVGIRTIGDVSKHRFIYDEKGCYCNDSVVVLNLWYMLKDIENITIKRTITKQRIVNSNKYSYNFLQAVLNSKVIKFYFKELMHDGLHFYPNHMKALPIKITEAINQRKVGKIVDEIIVLKTKNKDTDTTALEHQIDLLVYKLYNLTYPEVQIIDPAFALSEAEYAAV
ncbi:MAG: N-6 DNA methylase [Bacteroidia bacterium]|nr:N-6 DNA methylase [Bacteroidia bacterium]